MGILIGIVVVVLAFGLAANILASPETKLFRRIWSTEKVAEFQFSEERSLAVDQLLARFRVDFTNDSEPLDLALGNLISAAAEFDIKNPNNLGVQVSNVLAGELSRRIPQNTHEEIRKKLNELRRLDVVGISQAIKKTISEI